ncbi:hypothetical protein SLNWT_1977 [Streptomyces albus]|uniref:Uncharacterized protein n=1 Tax=Streptomyces albus (strain ATCC 21838 / DSM 41398 / FERM P-419 / JCM 4703 / NBRC 107858) TaxID=1081613 RepID=A0A0B5EJD3_STRA4|nr:hypothetical protein SLNWT_1977 [Streptomyces albus]
MISGSTEASADTELLPDKTAGQSAGICPRPPVPLIKKPQYACEVRPYGI